MDWQFIFSWCKIVLLDLTLAGDNAVVIAMAVRTLLPANNTPECVSARWERLWCGYCSPL